MATSKLRLLQAPILNGWKLFLLVTMPVSLVVIVQMFGTNYATAAGVSTLIQLSVRFAVPLLYLTFAASSLYIFIFILLFILLIIAFWLIDCVFFLEMQIYA